MSPECMTIVAAVAAPLLGAIRVLWARLQSVQDERTEALRDAARMERERREQIEAMMSGAQEVAGRA